MLYLMELDFYRTKNLDFHIPQTEMGPDLFQGGV